MVELYNDIVSSPVFKIIAIIILGIFLLWLVTAGIGYDDPDEPNQFDID